MSNIVGENSLPVDTVNNGDAVANVGMENTEEDAIERKYREENDKQFKKTLRGILLGPSEISYWPGIKQLRNLLLTVIFVSCDFIDLRLYGLGLVLGVYLLILAYNKPYYDRTDLWSDVSVTTSLLVLHSCFRYV